MICPKCGSDMSEKKKRCDVCGQDFTLYKKILRTANAYYNIGLRKAKVRDLSGSILCLKKCLELNKRHMYARNLLGLVYYEVGETVSAFSEWVISKHFHPEHNDADEYMEMIQENPTKLDTLNQTIKKYNSALTAAKQGSEDLAIIQLKKVVTLNPHFVKALQLLGLLYIKVADYEKAKRCLLRASRIDISNETTLMYLKEIDLLTQPQKDDNKSGDDLKRTEENVYHPHLAYKEDKPNVMLFINLLIGVLLGVAITYILVIPSVKKQYTNLQNENHVDYSEAKSQKESLDNTIVQLQQENKDLEDTISGLKDKVKELEQSQSDEEIVIADYSALFEAVDLYLVEIQKKEADRDYPSLAQKLVAIDASEYTLTQATALLNSMKEKVCKTASEQVYEKGHDLYGEGKYEEALVLLNEALTYDSENLSAIYFIARSNHKLNNKEQAALYYDILITDYPDSTRAEQAKQFIGNVQ